MNVILIAGISITLLITGFYLWIKSDGNTENLTKIVSKRDKHDAESKITQALKSIENSNDQATIITNINTSQNKVALTFDGITNHATISEILDLLDKYQAKGTFFVTGIGAAEDPAVIDAIIREKQELASYSLTGQKHMEKLATEDLIKDYCRAQVILSNLSNKEPNLLKCNVTNYTEDILRAAYASGFKGVVQSNKILNYKSFSSYEMALNYVKKLHPGAIISIKLEGYLDDEEYQTAKKEKPAEDKKSTIQRFADSEGKINTKTVNEQRQLIQMISWLLQAIKETQLETQFVKDFPRLHDNQFKVNQYLLASKSGRNQLESTAKELEVKNYEFYKTLREENKGVLAEEIRSVYTTEQAVAYTFYGIRNQTVLDDILKRLYQLGAKGTFFVTAKDIEAYPEAINQIIKEGHEVGIAVLPLTKSDFYTVCDEIGLAKQYLREKFNVETTLVKQPWGKITVETKEAVSAMGCKLITQGLTVVQTMDANAWSAEEEMNRIFEKSMISLQRGQIVYFRMDYFKKSDTLLGELMEKITSQKLNNIAYTADLTENTPKNSSVYNIKGVNDLLNNRKKIYEYPLTLGQILPGAKNSIGGGHLAQMDNRQVFQHILKSYIGNPSVKSADQLPGFNEEEIAQIDKIGKIKAVNDKKVIFLTFDDWGTDASVNPLLYVLRKHHVKATFFIRTNNVSYNPNLLRAIAEEGHDIASHTDTHMSLAKYNETTGAYDSIMPSEEALLEEDVLRSYRVLESIIGDMKNEEGRPILTKMFRPPTLAVSRLGLEAVLDSGFEYIVSGDFSTHDYEADSVESLKETLKKGILLPGGSYRTIGYGSIIVLHMSDNSKYTAQAIDEFLTENEMKPLSEKFTFARLSDYL